MLGSAQTMIPGVLEAATARVTTLETDMKSLRTLINGLFSQISRKPIDDRTRSRVENALRTMRLTRALWRSP
jgi:hypothetical protein